MSPLTREENCGDIWPGWNSFAGFVAIIFVLSLGVSPTVKSAEPYVLRFGIDAGDLGTGDPHRAASRNDRAIVDMIFNGLLRYKPGDAPKEPTGSWTTSVQTNQTLPLLLQRTPGSPTLAVLRSRCFHLSILEPIRRVSSSPMG